MWPCICVLAFSIIVPSAGSSQVGGSQQNASRLQTVAGIVSTVDSVGSTLVINVSNQNEAARFIVDQGVKIHRGSEDVFLDDIQQGDLVTLRYYETPDGTARVTSMVDSNLANDF